MKTIGTSIIALLLMSVAACGSSNSNLKTKVGEARTDVNESLERVEDEARPVVSPVAKRVDRAANQASAKVGLRDGSEAEKEK